MAPFPSLSSVWTQFFPPSPHFTADDIPADLSGKVYMVTGATAGMGRELTRLLYERKATVYLACRSEEKARKVIGELESRAGPDGGKLVFLPLDLANLVSVSRAAQQFLSRSSGGKLHVLFNNAGVMPSSGGGSSDSFDRTAQGHELALGVNCLGHFLLARLLMPALEAAAAAEPPGAVRVVWLSSFGLELYAPPGRGIDMQNLAYERKPRPQLERYGVSKGGDWLLAVEFARRHPTVLNVPVNPGNVHSDLLLDQPWLLKLLAWLTFYPTLNGVYSQLFAAFAKATGPGFDVTKNWVIPWGRIRPLRPDLPEATRAKDDGGTGNAREFWEWCEEQAKDYM